MHQCDTYTPASLMMLWCCCIPGSGSVCTFYTHLRYTHAFQDVIGQCHMTWRHQHSVCVIFSYWPFPRYHLIKTRLDFKGLRHLSDSGHIYSHYILCIYFSITVYFKDQLFIWPLSHLDWYRGMEGKCLASLPVSHHWGHCRLFTSLRTSL